MTRQASPPSILKLRYMLRNARSGHGSVWGLNVQRQTFAEPPRRRIAPRQRRDADGRRQAKEPSPAHVAPSLSQARGFHVDPVTTALASASSASTMTTPMPPRCVALFLSCKIIFVICEIKVEWRGQCHSAPEKRLRLTYPSGRTADNLCLHLRPNFPENRGQNCPFCGQTFLDVTPDDPYRKVRSQNVCARPNLRQKSEYRQ